MSITRRLDQAREAFRHGDHRAAAEAHEPARIAAATREEIGSAGSEYLGDLVYGGLDGILTTLALVSAAVGADLRAGIVVVLGVANLLADGFSMAAGAYLSARSDQDYYAREREREAWELENFPDGERAELLEIYRARGYSEEDARALVTIKTRDKQRWLDEMMIEELGLVKDAGRPLINGLTTLIAFILGGIVPLLAYLWGGDGAHSATASFRTSVILSGLALATLGAAKGTMNHQRPGRSGIEMLLAGGVAAGIAYGAGCLLAGLARAA